MELLDCFTRIKDFRRKQGQRYELSYTLLFIVLAILSNATGYRTIAIYIEAHLKTLKELFKIEWKRAPSYVQIRTILLGISIEQIEDSFRRYSTKNTLEELDKKGQKRLYIAMDGKTLRGSIDRFEDQRALHQISAFDLDHDIILAHIDVSEKSNEIPAVQTLIKQLGLKDVLYTLDALHCQKKRFK
jgi:hypothetical protein